jgi:hypothetical protein
MLSGPSRTREVIDALHTRLAALQPVPPFSADVARWATLWDEHNCSSSRACRTRFRYPSAHDSYCSNDTLPYRMLVDLPCKHPCEKAVFHRMESCLLPLYPLLRFARHTAAGAVLLERTGFLTPDLEDLFWRSLNPTGAMLRYDDHVRRGVAWNSCWNPPPKEKQPLPVV